MGCPRVVERRDGIIGQATSSIGHSDHARSRRKFGGFGVGHVRSVDRLRRFTILFHGVS